LTRTSVFRLVEDGWLIGQRSGRRSLYALTQTGTRHIEHAQRRIYAPGGASWDGTWTLLVMSGAALDARERGALRRELAWEGFAALAPGVLGHPSHHPESVREILAALGAEELVSVFAARSEELGAPGAATQGAAALARASWPLETLAADYDDFVRRFAELPRRAAALEDGAAFAARTLLIHAYRRLVLHDPQLPAQLLPANWPGYRAYEICQASYAGLLAASQAFLVACMASEAGTAPRAAPSFAERFAQRVPELDVPDADDGSRAPRGARGASARAQRKA
jgi:phenylacetic acid degradation operon negative regulatory protein